MSWNGGRDPKKHPLGGDILTDGETSLLVHFVSGDDVYLCKKPAHGGEDQEQWVHVPITQWRDEVRRSSVHVVVKFL